MKPIRAKDYFKVGENNIGWVDNDFTNSFGDMPVHIPKDIKFRHAQLSERLTFSEIKKKYNAQVFSLGEIASAMRQDELQKTAPNFFFIKNARGALFVVCVYWDAGYGDWFVYVCPFGLDVRWFADDRVFFRTLDTKSPRPESLETLPEKLVINGVSYQKHD